MSADRIFTDVTAFAKTLREMRASRKARVVSGRSKAKREGAIERAAGVRRDTRRRVSRVPRRTSKNIAGIAAAVADNASFPRKCYRYLRMLEPMLASATIYMRSREMGCDDPRSPAAHMVAAAGSGPVPQSRVYHASSHYTGCVTSASR